MRQGNPIAPTPPAGDSSNRIATTAFVAAHMEFFSVAAIQGIRLTAIADRIRLTFPHGSMVLKRQAGAPAHLAYVRSADGAYYVFESGTIVPEIVGAVGDDSFDNTAALIAFAVALQALKPLRVAMAFNGVYRAWPTDASAVANQVLMRITGWSNFIWEFNGAQLYAMCPFASAGLSVYGIIFKNCRNFELRDYYGVQNAAGLASDRGVRHVYAQDGCTQFNISNMRCTRGLEGFSAFRNIGDVEARCRNFHVSGYFDTVFYPHSLKFSGDDSSFDIETYNCGRSLICYNMTGVKGRIYSTPSNVIQDLVINVYGVSAADLATTEDVEIEYISPGQLVGGGSMVAITIQQADPAHVNYAVRLRNIRIKLNVNQTGGYDYGMVVSSLKWSGVSLVSGDTPQSTLDNVIVTGMVNGNLHAGGGNFLSLATTANGFSVNTRASFAVNELEAFDVAVGSLIGPFAAVRINGLNMPAATLTPDAAAPGNVIIVNGSRISGLGGGDWFSGRWDGAAWKYVQYA